MDCIELNEMVFHAYHGVMEQERKVGNTFIVDLRLYLDLGKASQTDSLTDTVSYADVYERVRSVMQIPSNLLEHAAGRIISDIHLNFPTIQEVELRLRKINPPVGGDIQSSAVILKRKFS